MNFWEVKGKDIDTEYEKEEGYFNQYDSYKRKLTRSIMEYFDRSCLSHILPSKDYQLYNDNYLEFVRYVIVRGEDYYNKCLTDIPYCILQSIEWKRGRRVNERLYKKKNIHSG